MRKPFWLIDGRLREAAYFLDGMTNKPALDEARHHFSAFLSAFVSVFDALDRTLRDVSGFIQWWDEREEELLTDATVAYLWKIRNEIVHEGLNPLGVLVRDPIRGASDVLLVGEWLPLSENNARMVCGRAMLLVARACAEAYSLWWSNLDLPTEITIAELAESGRTLEMIELELGLPAGWSAGDDMTPDARLRILRLYSETAVKELMYQYQSYDPPAWVPSDNSLANVIARRRKARHRHATGDIADRSQQAG